MDWNNLPTSKQRVKLFQALRQFLTQQSYDNGDWSLSDLIAEDDPRKYVAYQVLEGIQPDGSYRPDLAANVMFCFRVMTRQAVCRDKDGNKVWLNSSALETYGNDGDTIPAYTDKPKPGDVVEWKGRAYQWEPDSGKPVDIRVLKKWAQTGKRPNEYLEFVVDDQECIRVGYPHALEMLSRKGYGGPKPQFRKINIRDKEKRRLTNWWFREVRPEEVKTKRARNMPPRAAETGQTP